PLARPAGGPRARKGLAPPHSAPRAIVELVEEELAAARARKVALEIADDGEGDHPREGGEEDHRAALAHVADGTVHERHAWQVGDEDDPEGPGPSAVAPPRRRIRAFSVRRPHRSGLGRFLPPSIAGRRYRPVSQFLHPRRRDRE